MQDFGGADWNLFCQGNETGNLGHHLLFASSYRPPTFSCLKESRKGRK